MNIITARRIVTQQHLAHRRKHSPEIVTETIRQIDAKIRETSSTVDELLDLADSTAKQIVRLKRLFSK